VEGGFQGPFQFGDTGLGTGQFARGAGMVQFARESRLSPLTGDIHVVPSRQHFPAGDVDPGLKPPEVDIVACQFPPKGDQGVPKPLLRSIEVRRGCLDAAAETAEEVNFPGSIEAREIEILLAASGFGGRGAEDGCLIPAESLVFARDFPFRQKGRGRNPQLRPCLQQPRRGDLQVQVARNQPGHEGVKERVVEKVPP